MTQMNSLYFPSGWRRLAVSAIDWSIFLAVAVVIGHLFPDKITVLHTNVDTISVSTVIIHQNRWAPIAVWLLIGAFFAYNTILLGVRGQTLGNMITKTHVVNEYTFHRISIGAAARRTFCQFLLVPIFPVDWAWMRRSQRNQKLHDRISRTVVLQDRVGTRHLPPPPPPNFDVPRTSGA
jgi:uncharacterized RDD family membrane protein YckC